MIVGKLLWEYERSLHSLNTCPTNGKDVEYYLHAWWHAFSAAGHYYWCRGIEGEWRRVEMEDEGNRKRRKTV